MCKNKGLTQDDSADLHATVNNRSNKYSGKHMPSC